MSCRSSGSAALLLAALALPSLVSAQAPDPRPDRSPSTALIDVPFVPQSEALCGGAAVAMVLRYWGEPGVYAEDFADLVVDSGEGIRTTDLATAVAAHGWQAVPFVATRQAVRGLLHDGRPVIALIEDRPGVYHYVVIIAWGDAGVVLHDPARGPFRTMSDAALERAWRPAGHWAMHVLPAMGAGAHDAPASAPVPGQAAAAVSGEAAPAARTPPSRACTLAVTQAVAAAQREDFALADRRLDTAEAHCGAHAVLVQRAGLRFREERWVEAAALAERIVAYADDAYGWQLLASSRYMLGEADGALAAWNRIDRPRADLTRIDGLRRTPYQIAADAVGMRPGALVTASGLAHGRRRLGALPTIARARIDYRPMEDGRVRVDAAVVERPLLPASPAAFAALALQALVASRARVVVAGPLGAGEVWRVEGAWRENREAAAIRVSLPHVLGTRTIASLQVDAARVAFGGAVQATTVRAERQAAALDVHDWASATLWWHVGAAVDDWGEQGRFAGAVAGVTVRPFDRLGVRTDAGVRVPVAGGGALPHAVLVAVARSEGALGWSLSAGVSVTDRAAPVGAWSGAGTTRSAGISAPVSPDHGLPGAGGFRATGTGGVLVPLRAHALTDADGVLTSRFWAPRLGFAGAELRRRVLRAGPVDLDLAVFADAVLAAGGGVGETGTASRGAVDLGAGVLFGNVATGATVRVDAAWSPSDGATAVSVSAALTDVRW